MLTPVPPTDCMHARGAASERLDGELSELETVLLEAHLRGCAECRSYVSGIEAVAARLRSDPLEIPAFTAFAPRRRRPALHLRVAAVAATVAAATASSFAIGQMLGSHSQRPAATVFTTSGVSAHQQPEVLGMLTRARPGRSMANRVIPV